MESTNKTMVMRTDRVVNTRFTETMYLQIAEIAEREDRTVSYMIRRWVTDAVAADSAELKEAA